MLYPVKLFKRRISLSGNINFKNIDCFLYLKDTREKGRKGERERGRERETGRKTYRQKEREGKV